MKTSILAAAAVVLMGSAGFASAASIKPQCNRFLLWDLRQTSTFGFTNTNAKHSSAKAERSEGNRSERSASSRSAAAPSRFGPLGPVSAVGAVWPHWSRRRRSGPQRPRR